MTGRSAALPDRRTSRGRAREAAPARDWRGFAVTGLVATAAYLLLPPGSPAQAVVFFGTASAAAAAVVVGLRRYRPPGRRLWTMLVTAQVLYVAATAGWLVYPVVFDGHPDYPSLVDAFYFAAYLGWAGFLLGLCRRHEGRDRTITLDALIVTGGLGVIAWEFLIEPAVTTPGLSLPVKATSTAYPILVLLLATTGLRLAATVRLSAAPTALLAGWLVAELASDVAFSVASTQGTFDYGQWWSAGWLLSYTAFGSLMLHPGMTELTAGRPRSGVAPLWLRLTLLMLSIAAPLAVVVEHTAGGLEALGLGGALAVTVGLLVIRLGVLSRSYSTEQLLRQQVEQLAEKLRHTAMHDSLTGLNNRAAFDSGLERALARRQRADDHLVALVLVDLDSFKAVNDSYGHGAGDDLLRAVAHRLKKAVRASDLVARIGGDEFAVVLEDSDLRTALLVVDRLTATLGEPVTAGDLVLHPSASIGVYTPQPGDTVRDALIGADAALYAAKAGGAGYEIFDPARHRQFIERYQLEVELRAAVEDNQLVLHYQPVLDLRSRQVVSAEALIRWQHPTRGLLAPAAFMGVAEDSGVVVELGRWVLRQACLDAAAWQARPGAAGVGVAVNVSQRQFRSTTLLDDVGEAILHADLAPHLLTLEVTETSLATDTEEMIAALQKLESLGVELAMDDFGTGYSSLAQLRQLPIHVLKIDRGFVSGIAREDEEWALAAAIVRLAGSLGKRTLAEGIERASQLAHLRTLGCELGQGFLFAKPMPLADLHSFFAGHRGR